jgi:[pyruvate, water dikinase]-phosphate phosphotransferase / [pyruvate, water dikinase] kinase
MKNQLNIHLISDSTGETVTFLCKAVIAQFPNSNFSINNHFLINSENKIQDAINKIKIKKGIVLYSIVKNKIKDAMKYIENEKDILCIPAITPVVDQFREFFNIESVNEIGRQHEVDEGYYQKIESINYTLLHDDGNLSEDLHDADIIILGVSRSSKSPTSIYLAYKGYKVGNIPFIKTELMPKYLKTLTKPLIVGFTISPERLQTIRNSRVKTLEVQKEMDYIDIVKIQEEVSEARRYFNSLNIDVINVTSKSIEETAVYILRLLQSKTNN